MQNNKFKKIITYWLLLGLHDFALAGPLRKLAVGMGILSAGTVSAAVYQRHQLKKINNKEIQCLSDVINHQQVSYKMTPTEAYLTLLPEKSVNALYVQIEQKRGQYISQKVESICKQALSREQTFKHTHNVFYHGHEQSLIILQDITRKIIERIKCISINDDFFYLRAPANDYDILENYESFIAKHKVNDPFDHHPQVASKLLSVNFSLYAGERGESSFESFVNNYSVNTPHNEVVLERSFPWLNYLAEQKLIDALCLEWKLLNCLGEQGALLQVFVPQKHVDNIAYLALPYGLKNESFGQAISNVIRKYCDTPEEIGDQLYTLQARLCIDNSILLNPASGVKIFRYATWSLEQKKEYEEALENAAKALFDQVIAHPDFPRYLSHEPLGKVVRYNDLFKQEFTRWNRPEDKALFGLHANHAT